MDFRTGHFTADGGLIYLPIGFVPDYFELYEMTSGPVIVKWWSAQETDLASGSQEGICIEVDQATDANRGTLLADSGDIRAAGYR
jgi:hypothetical protein